MPTITITFDHPQADVPKYKFGDRVVVINDCAPQNWLTGEIIGLALEQEVFKPRWWYSVKLNSPTGYTEEYQEDELVPAGESQRQLVDERASIPLPKFQAGTRVKLNAESGFSDFLRDFAVVVSSKYVSNEAWSGWTYELTNKDLSKPIEIGEIWLELVANAAKATHNRPVSK